MRSLIFASLIAISALIGIQNGVLASVEGQMAVRNSPRLTTLESAGPISATPTPTPQVNPIPVANPEFEIVQLTEGSCCVRPSWTKDSEWVIFVDRPGEDEPAGLYGVPSSGGERSLITSKLGSFSDDLAMVAYPESGLTYIERWAIGTRWTVPTEGRVVNFSPDNQKIVWEVGSRGITYPDTRQRAVWIAELDGSNGHELIRLHGGQMLGWLDGGEAILTSGRLSPPDPSALWRISIEDGAGLLLLEVAHPRSVLVSPEGKWIAFIIAFEIDSDRNGIWVMKSDGSAMQKLPLFGAYRWRREGELLLIPYESDEKPSIIQFDFGSGEVWRLTASGTPELPIANNEWVPSPNGKDIIFRSSEDGNLWRLRLPEP